jgi:hypothetical protein
LLAAQESTQGSGGTVIGIFSVALIC